MVDFHFDIMCPWAYQASIWMRDVTDRLGLTVRWRFFSPEEIPALVGQAIENSSTHDEVRATRSCRS